MKLKMLITGGEGDLSKVLADTFSCDFEVHTPSRSELDVTKISSVDEYFSNKCFDVVINNAGTLYSSLVKESDPIKWINDINVNLIGTYLISRKAIRINENVKIINVSSTAAFNAYKDWTSYCAAKAGVLKLSLGLKNDGYDVYCLCPGAIDTKLRNGLNISNKNVMTISEAVLPFKSVLNGKFDSGDIIFYRKGELTINP